jgi:hypothetical protein
VRKRLISSIALLAASMVGLGGCATFGQQTVNLPPSSIQMLEYYPFQVKGYQGSYPNARMVVLTPVEARSFQDAGSVSHEPEDGNPAIGAVFDKSGQILQRLYTAPFDATVQKAIAHSTGEAGMTATTSQLQLKDALLQSHGDYVLASRITRCWVNKHRGAGGDYAPAWHSTAEFKLDVTIYKPPFGVPFWQGTSESTYNDPPVSSQGMNPEDETEIYDQPGQVLSVALTRAVAGIFKREALRKLVLEDPMRKH